MSKIEITADMVERARIAAMKANEPFNTQFTVAFFMTVLDAALNPPPVPEIPVSEGMVDVVLLGLKDTDPPLWRALERHKIVSMYRIMEMQRRSERVGLFGITVRADDPQQSLAHLHRGDGPHRTEPHPAIQNHGTYKNQCGDWSHRRKSDGPHTADWSHHRRKDDPK